MRTSTIKAALISTILACAGFPGHAAYGDDSHDAARSGHHTWKLLDAKGQVVGALVSIHPDAFETQPEGVILDVNGATVYAPVHRAVGADGQVSASRYVWGTTYDFNNVYPTADCSGAPWIVGDPSGALRPSLIVRQESEVMLYIAPDTWSTRFRPGSTQSVGSPCSVFGGVARFTQEGWMPESSFSLTQHYPEPLTVGD